MDQVGAFQILGIEYCAQIVKPLRVHWEGDSQWPPGSEVLACLVNNHVRAQNSVCVYVQNQDKIQFHETRPFENSDRWLDESWRKSRRWGDSYATRDRSKSTSSQCGQEQWLHCPRCMRPFMPQVMQKFLLDLGACRASRPHCNRHCNHRHVK